jgi:hypothetical protein
MTVSLGTLLSMSTYILLTEFANLHAAIEHLAGGPVWTHQLPAAMESLHPELLRQHPWLAEVDAPDDLKSEQDVHDFLAPLVDRYGDVHAVTSAPSGWASNPIADLTAQFGADRVAVVVVDGPAR